MATAAALAATATTGEQWYSKKQLFPSEQILGGRIVSPDAKFASIAFATSRTKNIVEFYATEGRAVKCVTSKKLSTNDENRGTRGIRKLGICPRGLFSSSVQDARIKAFPSSISCNYYACASTDLHPHHQAVSQRASYVEKAEDGLSRCPFSFCVRNFAEDISLLTFEQDKHVHTCRAKNSHLLPLTAKEKMYFLAGVMSYGDVKGFHDAVLAPRAMAAYTRRTAVSRLDIMDLPAAERLARELGIDLSLRAGEGDFERAREILIQRRKRRSHSSLQTQRMVLCTSQIDCAPICAILSANG